MLELWMITGNGTMRLSYVLVKYCDQCNSLTIHPWEDSSPLRVTGSVEIGSVSAPARNAPLWHLRRRQAGLVLRALLKVQGVGSPSSGAGTLAFFRGCRKEPLSTSVVTRV
jgi:hypothetical protein